MVRVETSFGAAVSRLVVAIPSLVVALPGSQRPCGAAKGEGEPALVSAKAVVAPKGEGEPALVSAKADSPREGRVSLLSCCQGERAPREVQSPLGRRGPATATLAAWALPALELVNWGSQASSAAACRSCLPLVVGVSALCLGLGCCSGCAWGWIARGAVSAIPPSAVRLGSAAVETAARSAAQMLETEIAVRQRSARPQGTLPRDRARAAARPAELPDLPLF